MGENLARTSYINFANKWLPQPGFEVELPALPAALPMSEQVAPERCATFPQLRDTVHAYQYAEMAERLRTNPRPTTLELSNRAFAEEVEPQVRDAVLELWQKGYRTSGSGFTNQSNAQFIGGGFLSFDEDTIQRLATVGVNATDDAIWFDADTPDLVAIKHKWDTVASLIPSSPEPAPVFTNPGESEPVDPASYLEGWLKYGVGASIRPSLLEEIVRRNSNHSS